MKRAFIIHGWKGRPDTNWKPWLKRELDTRGIKTEIPVMPNPDNPDREEWVNAISDAVGPPDTDTILIGHSLGCISILLYLQSLSANQHIGEAIPLRQRSECRISNFETFKDKLHAKPVLVHNMGHFGSADGCFELPIALKEILAL